ncbi:hypothetical protein [Novosphingobium sp. CECT 9465]|nr:hypothetical protein [Novosphingobium sp. CECT 9465]
MPFEMDGFKGATAAMADKRSGKGNPVRLQSGHEALRIQHAEWQFR